MVKVIDVGQSAGKIITQNTGSVSPGEVRPDLRVTFSATISRLLTLLDRVDQLAQQSEQYFWQMRITDLSINSMNFSQGMLGKLTDGTGVENAIEGAQKLCLAAHPMLDEILERIAYICDWTITKRWARPRVIRPGIYPRRHRRFTCQQYARLYGVAGIGAADGIVERQFGRF